MEVGDATTTVGGSGLVVVDRLDIAQVPWDHSDDMGLVVGHPAGCIHSGHPQAAQAVSPEVQDSSFPVADHLVEDMCSDGHFRPSSCSINFQKIISKVTETW